MRIRIGSRVQIEQGHYEWSCKHNPANFVKPQHDGQIGIIENWFDFQGERMFAIKNGAYVHKVTAQFVKLLEY